MPKEKPYKIPANDLVVKSNDFAMGVFDDRYTVLMRDILATAISLIDTSQKVFKPVSIPVSEFINIDDGRALRRLGHARKALLKATVEYTNPNGQWDGWTIFSHIHWEHRTALLELKFNEELRDDLLDLRKKFTEYRLSMYRKMTSKYSKDLYEKLSVWLRHYRQHSYWLEDLQKMLSVPASRREWKEFRSKILDPAVSEINEKTNWTIEYRTEKKRLYDKKTGKRRLKTSNIIFIRTDENAPSGYEIKNTTPESQRDIEQFEMFSPTKVDD